MNNDTSYKMVGIDFVQIKMYDEYYLYINKY